MANKIREIFNSDYKNQLNELRKMMIEERLCCVCKRCIDISDDRNTCYKCEYGGFAETSCLLWEEE